MTLAQSLDTRAGGVANRIKPISVPPTGPVSIFAQSSIPEIL